MACCSKQCNKGWLRVLHGYAVYLLEEIWDLIRTSSPDAVAGMVVYLNSRLANKSPIVKQKACLRSFPASLCAMSIYNAKSPSVSCALHRGRKVAEGWILVVQTCRLIKYICAKGSSEFKKNISKHAASVRWVHTFALPICLGSWATGIIGQELGRERLAYMLQGHLCIAVFNCFVFFCTPVLAPGSCISALQCHILAFCSARIQQPTRQGHDKPFCCFDNRELTSYKGEPDPFKGDVPNQRVRDMAKEALDAMFAATDPSYSVSAQTPSFAVGPAFAVHRDMQFDWPSLICRMLEGRVPCVSQALCLAHLVHLCHASTCHKHTLRVFVFNFVLFIVPSLSWYVGRMCACTLAGMHTNVCFSQS